MRAFGKKCFVPTLLVCAALAAMMSPASWAAEKKTQDDIWADEAGSMDRRAHEERMAQLLKHIEEKEPEVAKKLAELKKKDPAKYRGEFYKAARKYITTSDQAKPGGSGRKESDSRDGYRERMKEREKKSIEEYVAWLKDNYPDDAAKLAELQKSKPDMYSRYVVMSKRKYGKIMETQKKNPELAKVMQEDIKLSKKRRELLSKIKTAKGKNRNKLTEELQDVVSARFDIVIKKKQLQYEALAKKIEQLHKQIQRQKAETEKLIDKKNKAISDRMKDLLAEDEKIKWDN